MKVFVVATYYHLMHAIAMALTFEEPSVLVFIKSYLDITDEMIERIRKTGVFSDVIGTDEKGMWSDFNEELYRTRSMSEEEIGTIGNSIFEKYITPYYTERLKILKPDSEIYIYNDLYSIYYYLTNHFDNIVGVEDGYQSIEQQLWSHVFLGDSAYKVPFIEKGYYPKALYRDEHVKKIISSCGFENIDDYYKEKIEILDFKDLVKKNKQEFRDALNCIFDIESISVINPAALVIGQPLDRRSRYCNAIEEYLLFRKIIKREQEKGRRVYYKPHPAERFDLTVLTDSDTELLPREFPIELLNYYGCSFEHGVAFASTALDTCTCIDKKTQIFSGENNQISQVTEEIQSFVKGEKISIQFCVIAPEMTIDTYIAGLSYQMKYPYIKTVTKFLVPARDMKEASSFYDPANKQEMIDQYKNSRKTVKDKVLWVKELEELRELNPSELNFEVVPCEDFSEWDILRKDTIRVVEYDYTMILDENNVGFILMREIIKSLMKRIASGMCFMNFTVLENQKKNNPEHYLSPGYIDDYPSPQIINRLLHRTVLSELKNCNSWINAALVLSRHKEGFLRKASNALYVNSSRYRKIKDGLSFFADRINEVATLSPEEAKLSNDDLEEFVCAQIADQLYGFIDWMQVEKVKHSDMNDQLVALLDRTDTTEIQRSKAMLLYMKTTIIEKEKVNRIIAIRERTFYKYSRNAIMKLAKKGVIQSVIHPVDAENADNNKSVVRKIQGFIRQKNEK